MNTSARIVPFPQPDGADTINSLPLLIFSLLGAVCSASDGFGSDDRIDLDDSAAKGEIFQAGQRPDGTPYKIGVIDLPSFYLDTDALRRGETEAHGTVHDVQVILDQFVREKVDACVVDLRLNGGGILPEAISITGLFVEGGTVVQVKPRSAPPRRQRLGHLPQRPRPGDLLGRPAGGPHQPLFGERLRDFRRRH